MATVDHVGTFGVSGTIIKHRIIDDIWILNNNGTVENDGTIWSDGHLGGHYVKLRFVIAEWTGLFAIGRLFSRVVWTDLH
jgi:hypothetical protein